MLETIYPIPFIKIDISLTPHCQLQHKPLERKILSSVAAEDGVCRALCVSVVHRPQLLMPSESATASNGSSR